MNPEQPRTIRAVVDLLVAGDLTTEEAVEKLGNLNTKTAAPDREYADYVRDPDAIAKIDPITSAYNLSKISRDQFRALHNAL
ncbi:hypothetical protein R1CP_23615 [Rhodococcus opacus]|uniref:Uncharacterized protein n=2 Tax=Rhodococcus opacus TaxID=37919 RepID=A0A1B1K9Z6_RHOOP|nr:hypothetical protein R1CP_23615 [Rhodococcus opacus]